MEKIDFDNADLAMIGIVVIMATLVVVAGVSAAVTFDQVLPFLDKLLIAFLTLVTPGGVSKIIKRAQEKRADVRTG